MSMRMVIFVLTTILAGGLSTAELRQAYNAEMLLLCPADMPEMEGGGGGDAPVFWYVVENPIWLYFNPLESIIIRQPFWPLESIIIWLYYNPLESIIIVIFVENTVIYCFDIFLENTTIFDHHFDTSTGEWRAWRREPPSWSLPFDDDVEASAEIFRPTAESWGEGGINLLFLVGWGHLSLSVSSPPAPFLSSPVPPAVFCFIFSDSPLSPVFD